MKFHFLLFLSFLFFSSVNCKESSQVFHKSLEEASYYHTSQGHALRYAFFKSPAAGEQKNIFFVKGRGTFLEFYEVLVVPLLDRGFNVWMCDLTGQGASSRVLKGDKHESLTRQHLQHVDSFDVYLKDMHDFLLDVVLPRSHGSLILGGYSTGGHLALRYLQLYPDSDFQSAFVISPLLCLKSRMPNSLLSYLLKTASWVMEFESYLPGTGHKDPIYEMDFSENPFTTCEKAFEEMVCLCQKHSSLVMGGASIGWASAAADSLIEVWKKEALDNLQIPLLIATGGDDGVVDISYNEHFCQQVSHSMHVYYPQGRHELCREHEGIKAVWWEDFDHFFKNSL